MPAWTLKCPEQVGVPIPSIKTCDTSCAGQYTYHERDNVTTIIKGHRSGNQQQEKARLLDSGSDGETCLKRLSARQSDQ